MGAVQPPAPPATVEPGYATTEFWGKLALQVVGLLTLTGVIHPAPGVGDAIVGIIGMVAPEVGYVVGRSIRKAGLSG